MVQFERYGVAARVGVAAVLLALAAATSPPALAQTAGKIPELASIKFAWLANGADWKAPPPGLGHGPIKPDPAYPFHSNVERAQYGEVTLRIADTKDPILKPWAAAQMAASNQEALSGRRSVPFSAQARCYPGGVPGQLLYPAEPFYFIQTSKEVWMIWQRDHMVRRVYLTDRHSENVKPSWFGESIGRYENGDTLVVDTIGLSTQNSYLDNFRTPHSLKEHVVEHFKLSADGRSLEVLVKVDDPDALNAPLYLAQSWRKVSNPLEETVCAENHEEFFSQQNLFPIPEATKPDF